MKVRVIGGPLHGTEQDIRWDADKLVIPIWPTDRHPKQNKDRLQHGVYELRRIRHWSGGEERVLWFVDGYYKPERRLH